MAIFGGKKVKKERPRDIDAVRQGNFVCCGCEELLPLSAYTPLSMSPCQHCQAMNFVPMRVAGFWLMEPLGGGGMGTVYKSIHEAREGVLYAVKVLPRSQLKNDLIVQTLVVESQVTTALGQHPCIVSAVASGNDGEEHFLASTYIEGERLDKRILRLGRIPAREGVLIALRMLAAVSHIYNRGYLYRDMKPENVIIGAHGAVLYDYGICLPVDRALEDLGDMVQGSPLYFPPERVTGEGERPCSEIYSLGMVLFHCLTGHPYFDKKSVMSITRLHIGELRVGHQEGEIREVLPVGADVVLKMVHRFPQHRYQTFVEVEGELYRLLPQLI